MAESDDPAEVVRRFCAAWGDGNLDGLIGFLAEDAIYHNIPMEPVRGHEQIRATIEGFTAGVERIEFRVVNLAAHGHVILTERIDAFVFPDRTIELPVMGTFEVRDGRIAAWRDYFDLNQLMSQLPSG